MVPPDRVFQEALSNVLRHAGASRTRVVLRYRPDAVELEVHDEGAADRLLVPSQPAARSGGHGLLGMRVRVAVRGGRLETGVRVVGGFSVRARFPLSRRFARSHAWRCPSCSSTTRRWSASGCASC